MKKAFVLSLVAGMALWNAGQAQAGEYACTVYCVGPSGSTTVTVRASSASDAAQIVDKQSDRVCQAAGYRASTSSTMSSSQCR